MTVVVHGLANIVPVANFTTNATSIALNGNVLFTFTGNAGNLPSTFKWTFGDGANSSSENATHQYTVPGTYSVTLNVTDTDGQSSAMTKNALIHVASPSVTIAILVRRLNATGDDIASKWYKLYVNGTLKTSMTFTFASNSDMELLIVDIHGSTMHSSARAIGTSNQTFIVVLDMYYLTVKNHKVNDVKVTFKRNSVSVGLTVRAGQERIVLLRAGTTDVLAKDADGTVLRDGTITMTRDSTMTFEEDEGIVFVPLAIGDAGLWIGLAIVATIIIFAIVWKRDSDKKRRGTGKRRSK
jgi:PKD repeat protein